MSEGAEFARHYLQLTWNADRFERLHPVPDQSFMAT
jgi:hypothetical protein